ncbi:hypothetical protein CEXT_311431 [Caerostris extrusa]|uniref:Uncharacterized protein n=1 Tax=Caerostris extrusa TaxID=172846 RepID=A0AAV4N2X2_CAEEX|nr:hypothetical protein CEXT_311431 [Caerostris extrusa]
MQYKLAVIIRSKEIAITQAITIDLLSPSRSLHLCTILLTSKNIKGPDQVQPEGEGQLTETFENNGNESIAHVRLNTNSKHGLTFQRSGPTCNQSRLNSTVVFWHAFQEIICWFFRGNVEITL